MKFNVIDETKDPAAVGGMQVVGALFDNLGAWRVLDPFRELFQRCGGISNLPYGACTVLRAWARTQVSCISTQVGGQGANKMEQGQNERDGDLNQNGRHADQKSRLSFIL